MRKLLLIVVLIALAGCKSAGMSRHTETMRETVVHPAPAVVEVPVYVYVPIPARMTARCNWVREAPLQDVLEVSRGRKRCLDRYEAQFGEIEQVQGSPVADEAPGVKP